MAITRKRVIAAVDWPPDFDGLVVMGEAYSSFSLRGPR